LNGIEMVCVNYHTPHDLVAFCNSVLDAPPKTDWHLTLVNVEAQAADTHTTDRIWRKFREQELETRIAVLNTRENVGYARACNTAAASAVWDHDFLVFLNADVMLIAGAVDDCVEALKSNPEWGVLGPRQVDSKERLTHAGIFGTLERPQHRAWRQPNGIQYADVREAVTVSGSAYFIRRSLWDLLTACPIYRQVAPDASGAFLPTPHYFEETYCSYHAQAHGSKVVYFGPVVVRHEWHQASPVGGWAERQFPVSQRIFRDACDVHGIPHD
jgi:GT2 family glycosyltransferase